MKQSNHHPKYGIFTKNPRRGNGCLRSRIEVHRLKMREGPRSRFSYVYFDESISRFRWGNALPNRKFYERSANKKLRHTSGAFNYSAFKRLYDIDGFI